MALTVTKLSWGTSATSSSTLTVSGGFPNDITASVGDMLVVFVSSENSGTNGAASISSVTDSESNTYTNRGITNYDPGAARAGVTVGIFTSLVTSAITDGTVTVNFSPNTQYKSAVVYLLEPTTSYTPTVRFVGSGATDNEGTTPISITTSSLSTDDVVFGVAAWEEAASSFTVNGDSDTTRGTWSSVDSSSSGFGVDWFGVFGTPYQVVLLPQYKTVTSSGTQTWDVNIGNRNPDYAANYIAFYEVLDEPTYSLAGDGGTYSISENTTTNLAYGVILAGATAAYLVTGTAVTTSYGKAIAGESAAYLVSGSTAGTNVGGAPSGITMAADGGSYVVSGTDATYDRNYVIGAATASYSVVGTTADTRKGQTVAASAGSYSVSGTANSFKYGYVVAADTSSYSISGTANSFKYGYVVAAATASYSVSGQDITMSAGQIRMNAEAGAYAVSGDNAGLYPAPASGTELRGPDPRISFWSNPDGLVLSYPYGYSFVKYIRRPYNVNGNGNIFISTDAGSGIFDARGHLRVTIVDGTTYTGIYASDGSVNAIVVDVDDVDPDQLFHSSGALRISQATIDTPGLVNQNNGSLLVANIP